MRISWIPREQKFYDMFDEVADLVLQAAKVFAELVERFDHLQRRVTELRELEHRSDMAVEKMLLALGRTFLTPFDREDIHALATHLDDVLDNMEEASYRLTSFGIAQPTPEAVKMALIIQMSCERVHRAVQLCRGRLGSQEMSDALREISRLENEADDVYRGVEADLFARPPADLVSLIKWKDVYDWLEATVDSCRDVAHVVNELVVKGS